jgi:hypothetical protein
VRMLRDLVFLARAHLRGTPARALALSRASAPAPVTRLPVTQKARPKRMRRAG